jgi:RpiR family carbohydrate utilization transcriptional regulator
MPSTRNGSEIDDGDPVSREPVTRELASQGADPVAPGASNGLLTRIEVAIPTLSRSEAKVADYVLGHPGAVVSLSIAALARLCRVSEPTVARFCKSIGLSGLKEFKLQLARSLAGGIPYVHQDVMETDEPAEIAEKVLNRSISALITIRDRLDHRLLARAIELLARARRVEFYGQGNSGIVALDAQHKFFRLGLPTAAYSDPHIHAMSAALLSSEDVVVAISASGRTLDLLRTIEAARGAGTSIIGITVGGSPLASLCDVTLASDVFEDPDVYSPMTSRLAHLAIIDVLAVAVAVAKGKDLIATLERAKGSLRGKRGASEA